MITCKVGKTKIDTLTYPYKKIKEWSNKGILRCPICDAKVIYCHGDFKIPHFKHEKNSKCTNRYIEQDTEEHMTGISNIYKWLKKQKYIEDIELEKWIPETRQRPDIFFKYKGKEYAIEFQCTPISSALFERRELYKLNQIKDIWIFGCEKYDIDKYKDIKALSTKDIHIEGLKLKKSEIELLKCGSVFYLNDNKIIKLNKGEPMFNFKTKYDVNIDINYINKVNVEYITSSENYNAFDSLYYERNKLRRNVGKLDKNIKNKIIYNDKDRVECRILKNDITIYKYYIERESKFKSTEKVFYEIMDDIEKILKIESQILKMSDDIKDKGKYIDVKLSGFREGCYISKVIINNGIKEHVFFIKENEVDYAYSYDELTYGKFYKTCYRKIDTYSFNKLDDLMKYINIKINKFAR